MSNKKIGIWFLAIQAGTGADVFTIRLSKALNDRGIQSSITWLPHYAEYLPWVVSIPTPPPWATVAHVNSWMHKRYFPPNLPLVVTLHHSVHDSSLIPFKSILQRLYHKMWIWHREVDSLHQGHAVTTDSLYTKNQIKKCFGFENTEVIPIWVNRSTFSFKEKRKQHSPFRLLYVGSLSKRKGVDLLPEVMEKLGNEFELRCTSDIKHLRKIGLSKKNIIALGRIKTEAELAEVYRNCDALLFPSRLEGFGLVALEAQACGLPVIATNGSSLLEVVEHGVTGLLCPQDDTLAFADAARELRGNLEKWKTMSHAAAMRAKEIYSEDRGLKSYVRIYQSIS